MKYLNLIILLLVVLFPLLANGCNEGDLPLEENPEKEESQAKDLDIYLLIGQSNMAGRAEIESQDRDTLNGVFLFKKINGKEWEKATNPLNKYSTIRKDLS